MMKLLFVLVLSVVIGLGPQLDSLVSEDPVDETIQTVGRVVQDVYDELPAVAQAPLESPLPSPVEDVVSELPEPIPSIVNRVRPTASTSPTRENRDPSSPSASPSPEPEPSPSKSKASSGSIFPGGPSIVRPGTLRPSGDRSFSSNLLAANPEITFPQVQESETSGGTKVRIIDVIKSVVPFWVWVLLVMLVILLGIALIFIYFLDRNFILFSRRIKRQNKELREVNALVSVVKKTKTK